MVETFASLGGIRSDSHTCALLLTFVVNQWKILKMSKSFSKSLEHFPRTSVCDFSYITHSRRLRGQNNCLITQINSAAAAVVKILHCREILKMYNSNAC